MLQKYELKQIKKYSDETEWYHADDVENEISILKRALEIASNFRDDETSYYEAIKQAEREF